MTTLRRHMRLATFLLVVGIALTSAYLAQWPSMVFPPKARFVKMAFGLALAPYAIAENFSGFELETIRIALAQKGYTLQPIFVPLAQVPELLRDKKVDAAERGDSTLQEGPDVHFAGSSAVDYQTCAISLKKNHLAINAVADLADKNVLAFQRAATRFGPTYASMAAANPRYNETADQKRQALMLFSGRIDVVVADSNIFKYVSGQVSNEVDVTQDVTCHPLFDGPRPIYQRPVFLDARTRDAFDVGLAIVKKDGRAGELRRRYVSG